ncbi:hypothetical protein ACFWOG_21405 [Kitasatospora sp. NPDC058406]|uniref:hypothetical protein n=1 Tax=Kitasatospora sp. NPDC058406 TaxID=3346483 RepID=UPI00365BA348
MRKSLGTALAAAVLAVGGSFAAAGPAGAAEDGRPVAGSGQAASVRLICYWAHVAGIGWQNGSSCNGAVAGTVGEGRAVEALKFSTSGMSGLCARAHVSTLGWQPWARVGDGGILQIGTTGQSLAIEAVEFLTDGRSMDADAHLSGYGWQGWRSGGRVLVGTTGENRAIEAIKVIG